MSTTGPHTALKDFLRIKPVDIDLAQKVAKAMDMNCDPMTGIVTGRSVIKTHRDDGTPVDVDVGERVVLCFEYNFMDYRREQLAAQKIDA